MCNNRQPLTIFLHNGLVICISGVEGKRIKGLRETRERESAYHHLLYFIIILLYRRVVEYGTYVKHLKVEVYLIDLKLAIHPHLNEHKQHSFSRADTISK